MKSDPIQSELLKSSPNPIGLDQVRFQIRFAHFYSIYIDHQMPYSKCHMVDSMVYGQWLNLESKLIIHIYSAAIKTMPVGCQCTALTAEPCGGHGGGGEGES